MKILVTGGAGFIGSHVVDAYLQQGHEVLIVDNLSTGDIAHCNPKASFINLDINDKQIHSLFEKEKFDLVNHHAAQIDVRVAVQNPVFDAQNNICGTLNLLQAAVASKVKKIIFISSGGAVYGELAQEKTPAVETHSIYPLSPYGISKHVVEHYLYWYHQLYGLDYTVLRYANVYGERQGKKGEAGVVSIFARQLLSQCSATIFGNGEQIRDYIYIQDVVSANLTVSRLPTKPKRYKNFSDAIYNIGTGEGHTVNHLFFLLEAQLQTGLKALYDSPRDGEVFKSLIDSSKAAQELGWKPEVSFAEGIRKTVAWFKKNSQNKGG
jgi:UDP-glucose 4-epimerase